MRVIFVIQVLLLAGIHCHIGQDCSSDENCLSFESCERGKCVLCTKQNAICSSDNWRCCEGNTCESIPGLEQKMCVPNNNNCRTNADCSGGLRCLARLGKCGLCHSNGEKCTLPYDTYECCSSYCAIHLNNTVCADPSLVETPTTPTTTTTTTTAVPERFTFNNNPYLNGSSRKTCTSSTDCPSDEKCSLMSNYVSYPYFVCVKCLNNAVCPGPYESFTDCCFGQSCKYDFTSPTRYRCR
jgi:hypothetical protein